MAANAAPPVAAAATQEPLQPTGGSVAAEGLPAGAAPEEQAPPAMPLKAAPSKSRSRSKSKGADSKKKKKKKKTKENVPRCVGYYLDALDKKMLWAEAKIIGCDVAKQKLRVHFIGWGKAHDIWTDTVSIAAHGRYAHKTKATNEMSWDGDMRLFEEMLGPIDESTPCHDLDLANTGNGIVVIPTSVAPPPPPTPSRRRAAKAKAQSSNGFLTAAAAVAPAAAAAANREAPKKSRSQRHTKVAKPAVVPTPRAEAPTSASAPRAKPGVASTGETISRKRSKKSPTGPQAAAKKRRVPSPALPEIASVQAVNKSAPNADGGVTDPLANFEARRRQLAQELELSVGFLEKCASIFKRQLSELVPS